MPHFAILVRDPIANCAASERFFATIIRHQRLALHSPSAKRPPIPCHTTNSRDKLNTRNISAPSNPTYATLPVNIAHPSELNASPFLLITALYSQWFSYVKLEAMRELGKGGIECNQYVWVFLRWIERVKCLRINRIF